MTRERLDQIFGALSDPTRRTILSTLGAGERSTGELAGEFPQSRPAISKHLKVLHDTGLVRRRKAGRKQLYALRAEPLAEAYEWLERYRPFWRGTLRRLKEHLEEE